MAIKLPPVDISSFISSSQYIVDGIVVDTVDCTAIRPLLFGGGCCSGGGICGGSSGGVSSGSSAGRSKGTSLRTSRTLSNRP